MGSPAPGRPQAGFQGLLMPRGSDRKGLPSWLGRGIGHTASKRAVQHQGSAPAKFCRHRGERRKPSVEGVLARDDSVGLSATPGNGAGRGASMARVRRGLGPARVEEDVSRRHLERRWSGCGNRKMTSAREVDELLAAHPIRPPAPAGGKSPLASQKVRCSDSAIKGRAAGTKNQPLRPYSSSRGAATL